MTRAGAGPEGGSMSHKHDWRYPHQVIEGRRKRKNEVAVWRYCGGCGVKQIAFAASWRKPPRQYDLEDD